MFLVALIALAAAGDAAPVAAPKWPEHAFFGLHYDLHPGAGDTELGRETTYEHIREQLEKVKPDFVQYDCKGHPGYSGYPTEVGSPSPGIVNDALRVWRDVTRDMGIPLSIHFSGVWDTRAIELHPEWARIAADGKSNPNNTDPLSDYTTALMIPQLVEVVTKYDLDGVWIDGENWASQPSWSERCIAEFTKRTGITAIPRKADDPHWFEWLAFQRDLFTEHVAKYTQALHEAKPDVAVCSNWMYSVRQPEPITVPVDYLSGDFDPSFGAERACAESRFLASRGLPWNLMAWAFLRTGDQNWTLKTVPHLSQEIAVSLAQGGAVFIYNAPQRSGRLTAWHQDILAGVADFCRKRQGYCFETETLPQIALLHSESFYYRNNAPLFNFASANEPMEGALHALLENGYSVDILNEEILLARMQEYPLVVVAEQEGLSDGMKSALAEYARKGGRLVLSGANVSKDFAELAGISAVEGQTHPSAYVPADNGCVTVSGPWQAVALNGAEALAPLLGQQEPELNQLGTPAATRMKVGDGVVVAVHGPAFRAYHQGHYPRLRQFIGDCVSALDSPRLCKLDGPWWIEMSARKREDKTLIQFVNRSASGYTAPNRHMVEHVPDAGPFTVTLPLDKKPTRCYMAPDESGLEWSYADGLLKAKISGLAIHNVLVVE
ncbi:MAG: family 10 glycosylhydrolase [Candidatus Hydrogenedentes bacterium]|nr:family 10 glycosylhydrolase [Candidatus Hydrogenedentota bacterium]